MLAPSLSDCLQLDVGRFAAQIAVVLLNGLKLDQCQAQRSLAAELLKLIGI
jgi:hypothetical protein